MHGAIDGESVIKVFFTTEERRKSTEKHRGILFKMSLCDFNSVNSVVKNTFTRSLSDKPLYQLIFKKFCRARFTPSRGVLR